MKEGTRGMTVELVRATVSDKAVLRRLLQLYHYDFSDWNGDDVAARPGKQFLLSALI
jgi:hypothetical protein